MDTVTYPDARVAALLDSHFHYTQIDIAAPDESTRAILREVKPIWAPLYVARNERGTELRRWCGWLPPDEFITELTFVLAMEDLLRRRLDDAYARFREACDAAPHASVAPEALFWAGAAAFKRGNRDYAALRAEWDELRQRFPSSTWARRADVFDQANNGLT